MSSTTKTSTHAILAHPSPKRTVYVLTYDASTWPKGVALQEGGDPVEAIGSIIGVYVSESHAKTAGLEWASQQVHGRIEAYHPPLKTQEDKEAAATRWLERPLEGLGVGWECEIYGRAEESLAVRVQEFVVDVLLNRRSGAG